MIWCHWGKIEPKYFPIHHLKTSLPRQKRISEGKPLLVRCPAEKPEGRRKKLLLRFSQTCELLKSKAAFTIVFFAAVNHNYDHKQRTLKHRNTLNGSKSTNHKSQTMTLRSHQRKGLFPKRSAKMIDGSQKQNC